MKQRCIFPFHLKLTQVDASPNVYEDKKIGVCMVRRWAMCSTRVYSKVCVVHDVEGFRSATCKLLLNVGKIHSHECLLRK